MKACENCEVEIHQVYGSGRFCSSKCARGFSTKNKRKEINERVSIKLKKNPHLVTIKCKECTVEFVRRWRQRKQIFCSKACSASYKNKVLQIGKIGGLKSVQVKKQKYQYTKQGREDGLSRKIHGLENGCSNQPPASTFIYTLSDDSGIRYVGKSDYPFDRLKNHLKECHKKRTKKERWLYELKCLGKKPIVEILEEIKTDEWENAEIYWIAQLKCWNFKLLNGTEGGEGSNGFKGKTHSEETKNKIRIKATGKRYTSKYTGKLSYNSLVVEL